MSFEKRLKSIPLMKIVEDCKASNKMIAVKDIAETFLDSFAILYNIGIIAKNEYMA